MSRFYIIYPAGDRTKLQVLELTASRQYELDDYALASRSDFSAYWEAEEHATFLAKKHNKHYVPAKSKHDYLD